MSALARTMLAVLTVSVVVTGVGLAGTSDDSPADRSRPVIIGRTGDTDDDSRRGGDDQPRQEPRAPREDPALDPSVVTPKPRDLTPEDDLDAPEDEDETDAVEDGTDDDTSEDVDEDEASEGGDD